MVSKKLLTLSDDDGSYLALMTCITLKFKLDGRRCAIQYFQPEWDDWINLDDDDELPASMSKVRITLQR